MAARLSALRAGRTLPPGFLIFKDSWYSFLLEAESTPGPVRLEGLGRIYRVVLAFIRDDMRHLPYDSRKAKTTLYILVLDAT
jgi:hypothetical protein